MKETIEKTQETEPVLTSHVETSTEDTPQLSDHFEHDITVEFEHQVNEYAQETGKSPFINIDMHDDTQQLQVDMDKKFEDKMVDMFAGEFTDILTDYMTAVIKHLMETTPLGEIVEAGKEADTEDSEDSEDTEDTENTEETGTDAK